MNLNKKLDKYFIHMSRCRQRSSGQYPKHTTFQRFQTYSNKLLELVVHKAAVSAENDSRGYGLDGACRWLGALIGAAS
ncbi:hypothetical protein F2Q69_00046191 [Brassica cretica]|uniref:Uncharacterized protein n=1 Tax=Brassica cretica TaxID=69181 RepID=A0A8S9PS08_BRACR|nr:hypothetical protein F2Q69_00046191 [Brassica cretica]